MSHFTVLVIGENPEEQLAPFQENNTGDCPQEYLKYRYDGEFYESEAAAKEALGEAFDPEDGYWENPNRKWDWYQLGGRWTGFFKLKNLPASNVPEFIDSGNGVLVERAKPTVGSPGLMTAKAEIGYADQCYKSYVDFESMRNDAGKSAQDKYELAMSFLAELPENERWEIVRGRFDNIDEARDWYHNQPRCKAWKEKQNENFRNDNWPFGWSESPDSYLISKEDYIENARNSAVTTHAVIKDGKWYEAGQMGWWGVVHDEKDSSAWNAEFSKLIDELPEDTLLSVYDCHI